MMEGEFEMNKQGLAKFAKSLRTTLTKRSPEILTGIGIAGMVTTTVLAVKATPKALQLLEEEKSSRFDLENGEALTKIEVVKIAWKPYIPAAVTGALSIACLVSSTSVNTRRNAALATAYKLSETALTEFKEKAVEVVGEKQVKDIKDKIAKDKVEENPVSKNNIIVTGMGSTLCMDGVFGRYFESDIETLRRIENNLNKELLSQDYISLNDFYNRVGLDSTDGGDVLGWNVDDGLLELEFSSQIADNGRPCIVVNYNIAPRYDFDKFA